LNAGCSDSGGWSMAEKAMESAELVTIISGCCSKARKLQQGGLELQQRGLSNRPADWF
jgi:hypothetical protein